MPEQRIKFVNVYIVTRHYGGPEEGGWWFNSGEPLASVPVVIGPKPPWVCEFRSTYAPDVSEHDKAILTAKTAELEAMFGDEARGDIYSVLGGCEIDVSWDDKTAAPWPEETPYYC